MSLKTSLFNKAIFQNTVKRFKWGSFLYFIILFLSVPFVFLVEDFDHLLMRVNNSNVAVDLLNRTDYMIIPVLLAFAVPTLAAVLIFNNVHSSKQAIFVHGLPVNRLANYVSSLVSGFVLMAAPVLLNGLILLVMSFTGYGRIIASSSVIYWIFINLSILFIMFSVSTCTAFLTGNAAAHIGINVLVHVFPLLCALVIALVSEVFLYGFISSQSFIALKIMENTPLVWLFSMPLSGLARRTNMFLTPQMWIYIIGAVAVYFLGYIFYKKRKIEASGDVVAFDIFKPIFKYIITGSSATLIFAIMLNMNIAAFYKYFVAVIVTFIAYFACEMIIGKTVKVFGKFIGYVGFILVCAAFISFFAYTSVFGYETRVPDSDKVVSATVYSGWNEKEPFIKAKDVIDNVIHIHNIVVDDIPVTKDEFSAGNRTFHIKYNLKNGKKLERFYSVPEKTYDMALGLMYESSTYKRAITEIDGVNTGNVTSVNFNYGGGSYRRDRRIDNASGLIRAIEKDIENLSYEEMEKSSNWISINVDFSCTLADNQRLNIFKDFKSTGDENDSYRVKHFDISINNKFKNAIAWLTENGYYEEIKRDIASALYICKESVKSDGEEIRYKDDIGIQKEFAINSNDCVKIDFPHGYDLAKIMLEEVREESKGGEFYYIYSFNEDIREVFSMGGCAIRFAKEELPEYLHEYVE